MHSADIPYNTKKALEQAKKDHQPAQRDRRKHADLCCPIKTPQHPDRLIGTLQRLFCYFFFFPDFCFAGSFVSAFAAGFSYFAALTGSAIGSAASMPSRHQNIGATVSTEMPVIEAAV